MSSSATILALIFFCVGVVHCDEEPVRPNDICLQLINNKTLQVWTLGMTASRFYVILSNGHLYGVDRGHNSKALAHCPPSGVLCGFELWHKSVKAEVLDIDLKQRSKKKMKMKLPPLLLGLIGQTAKGEDFVLGVSNGHGQSSFIHYLDGDGEQKKRHKSIQMDHEQVFALQSTSLISINAVDSFTLVIDGTALVEVLMEWQNDTLLTLNFTKFTARGHLADGLPARTTGFILGQSVGEILYAVDNHHKMIFMYRLTASTSTRPVYPFAGLTFSQFFRCDRPPPPADTSDPKYDDDHEFIAWLNLMAIAINMAVILFVCIFGLVTLWSRRRSNEKPDLPKPARAGLCKSNTGKRSGSLSRSQFSRYARRNKPFEMTLATIHESSQEAVVDSSSAAAADGKMAAKGASTIPPSKNNSEDSEADHRVKRSASLHFGNKKRKPRSKYEY